MSDKIRIAVDAMSGDLGPRVVISAVKKFLHLHPDTEIVLVGKFSQLEPGIKSYLQIIDVPEIVTMDDEPLYALRHKQKSSMWRTLEILKEDQADACVSAGNTGALMAMARHLIKTVPTIERPAICKSMPVSRGTTYLLDLGANIDVSPVVLHQFAIMGSALAKSGGIEAPRVALLNIGTESNKGTGRIQQAAQLCIQDSRLDYVGFVEADKIFAGTVNVIVCDGFHGNVALKASEGVARYISGKIRSEFERSIFNRVMAMIAWPVLKSLKSQLNPGRYNGACFLGLQKIVIKSHGSADESAFISALSAARDQVLQAVPAKIIEQFSLH